MCTPLHVACASREGTIRDTSTIVESFLKVGAEVNVLSRNGHSPLHYLSRRIPSEQEKDVYMHVLNLLLRAGAKINPQASNGETPLHQAVSRMNYYAVQFLTQQGANPHIRNRRNQTALDILGQCIKDTQTDRELLAVFLRNISEEEADPGDLIVAGDEFRVEKGWKNISEEKALQNFHLHTEDGPHYFNLFYEKGSN